MVLRRAHLVLNAWSNLARCKLKRRNCNGPAGERLRRDKRQREPASPVEAGACIMHANGCNVSNL